MQKTLLFVTEVKVSRVEARIPLHLPVSTMHDHPPNGSMRLLYDSVDRAGFERV